MVDEILKKVAEYVGLLDDSPIAYKTTEENPNLVMQTNNPDIGRMNFRDNKLKGSDIDFNLWVEKLIDGTDKDDKKDQIESFIRVIIGDKDANK